MVKNTMHEALPDEFALLGKKIGHLYGPEELMDVFGDLYLAAAGMHMMSEEFYATPGGAETQAKVLANLHKILNDPAQISAIARIALLDPSPSESHEL